MTTITLPRAVVEQALEALIAAYQGKDGQGQVTEAITALRAALAQQAEPVAWEGWWLHHGQHNYRAKPLTSERVKELMKLAFEVGREAALAQQAEPVAGNTLLKEFLAAAKEAGVTHLRLAEPVAYRYKYSDGFWRFSNGKRVNGCDPIESQALYTAPPQQAEPVDTDCHTQGICQRSGYGIGKQADPQIEDRLARHGIPKP